MVVTSRSIKMCERIIGDVQAWIAAENGYYVRRGSKNRQWEVRE